MLDFVGRKINRLSHALLDYKPHILAAEAVAVLLEPRVSYLSLHTPATDVETSILLFGKIPSPQAPWCRPEACGVSTLRIFSNAPTHDKSYDPSISDPLRAGRLKRCCDFIPSSMWCNTPGCQTSLQMNAELVLCSLQQCPRRSEQLTTLQAPN